MSVSGEVAERWALKSQIKLSDDQFVRWRDLLERRTGMRLADYRKTFLETNLNIRMREIQCSSVDDYYQRLTGSVAGELEWATLVDRLTVQETSFFRHPASYELVGEVSRQWLSATARRALQVWSVGCATGEEPYSLAMLMDEVHQDLKLQPLHGITATDISMPALSKARKGIFAARKVERLHEYQRERYFERLENGRYQARAQLKERLCFARVNVLEIPTAPIDHVDIIFCQNLLIYFQQQRKLDIVNQLVDKLEPGGLLVVGVGEVLNWRHPRMERLPYKDTLAFIKRGEP